MRENRAARRHRQNFPWGRYVGLLTTSMVILGGVIMGVDPLLILQRALLSGFLLGMIVGFGVGLIQLMDADRPRRDRAR